MVRLLIPTFLVLALGLSTGCVGSKKTTLSDEEMDQAVEQYNASVKEEKDRVICRDVMVTGSRIPRRVCKKPQEWWGKDQLEADEMMRRIRNQTVR